MSITRTMQNVHSSGRATMSTMGRGDVSPWASRSKLIVTPTPEDRMSPVDFCNFVPWLCKQWQLGDEVLVIKRNLEIIGKKKSPLKKKSLLNTSNVNSSMQILEHHKQPDDVPEDFYPIDAYFNDHGSLIEVALVNFSIKLDPRIIKIIIYCLPFNKSITKISFPKAYATNIIIHLLAEGLPNSFLTEICFDGSFIAGNEYYILLDKKSHLKYLSLKRCGIDDKVVEEMAKRLCCPSGDMLQILDLTSNIITDVGAKALGEMLRTNRQLVHLGLAGNRITDAGARHILMVLMEFSVTEEEICEMRQRKLKYMKLWKEVYEMSLQQVSKMPAVKNDTTRMSTAARSQKYGEKNIQPPRKMSQLQKSILLTPAEKSILATKMTESRVGKFVDVFVHPNVLVRDCHIFSRGNLQLASLNLAYNDLTFLSLKILLDVLKYQSIVIQHPNTGLVRVIVDGNRIPFESLEMHLVDSYLVKAVNESDSSNTKFKKKSIVNQKSVNKKSTE